MSLLPQASVKTKVDLTRSRFQWKRQFPVSATNNITEEGQVLARVIDAAGTGEVVQPTTTSTSERIAGIALHSRITATTFTATEEVTVPSASPYTVQLKHANMVERQLAPAGAAEAQAWLDGIPGGTSLASEESGTPISGEFNIGLTTGLVTFNSAQAGNTYTLSYRYTMTSVERDELLRSSHVNRGAEDEFGLMTVASGHCVVYTTMFDSSSDYYPGLALKTTEGGLWTVDDTGTDFGTCISAPTPNDPYLGVEYNAV